MDDQHLFPKSGATFFEWLNATGSGFRHVPSPQTCPVGGDRRDRPAPATHKKSPTMVRSTFPPDAWWALSFVLYQIP